MSENQNAPVERVHVSYIACGPYASYLLHNEERAREYAARDEGWRFERLTTRTLLEPWTPAPLVTRDNA